MNQLREQSRTQILKLIEVQVPVYFIRIVRVYVVLNGVVVDGNVILPQQIAEFVVENLLVVVHVAFFEHAPELGLAEPALRSDGCRNLLLHAGSIRKWFKPQITHKPLITKFST